MATNNNFFKDWTALTADLEKLVKTEDNPFFKSKFVPLKQILPMLKDKCQKHNFIFIQSPRFKDGKNLLYTSIIHKDGDIMYGEVELVSKDPNDPQKLGGAITYMRRYSLTCMFGLEEEDDDGNFASKFDNSTKTIGTCKTCNNQVQESKFPGKPYYCFTCKTARDADECNLEKSNYQKTLENKLNLPTYEDELDATEGKKVPTDHNKY
jgi:hypothetical protein